MTHPNITGTSMGYRAGTLIAIASLDRPPDEEWTSTFDHVVQPAVFGLQPTLVADRIVVDVTDGFDTACCAMRYAVTLTTALVDDHHREPSARRDR